MKEVYDKYYNKIYYWSLKKLRNKEDAEDLTNSIFVAIFEYLGKNINIQKLDNLIWKIAYNLWCKKIRNKKKDELLVEIKEDELIDVDTNIIDKIIYKDITKNIDKIGEYKVLEFRDYDKNIIKNMETGETKETGLPKSNVLYYDLENNSWCCVRPSGTEPKIKLYMGIKANSMESAEKKLEELKQAMENLVRNA